MKYAYKLEGWLEVQPKNNGYPESYFVTQIRGEPMSPQISSFEWRIFDANVSANDAANEVVLIHHEDIDDDYTNNLTIRTFNVEKQASKGLFDSLKIILSSFNSDFESIMLEDIQSNEQVGSVLIRIRRLFYEMDIFAKF